MSPRVGLSAERITSAAAELADEIGFDKVTLSAVARGFGVKDPSLYAHVRNLHDLRVRIALLASGEMADRIAAAVAGRSGRDALFGFAGAYRGYVLDHPGRYAATQMRLDPADVGDHPAFLRTIELTTALLRGYGLDEPAATDAVRLLRSTFHGFATLEAAGGFAHPRPTDTSWEHILDALHRTLDQWRHTDKEH
ncbi:Tetracycline repressor protein class B from transposon Tn10 [Nocardia otitidiscaviarum]|uniref:Tetracycline repressor protein class B from transposon Tn10 n=1 Tax=Nocardia otitidiscaviarum TaxID=1823 RepID=A0A379JIL0_9NOCA|nr:TetR-like C-terminal domain-containing protein [Nocardia otitidiscaviarum]SUD48489.1 Tetracycline repressor protein class B from transposon Tn10 [Nocardia otitidiscaviarum]